MANLCARCFGVDAGHRKAKWAAIRPKTDSNVLSFLWHEEAKSSNESSKGVQTTRNEKLSVFKDDVVFARGSFLSSMMESACLAMIVSSVS